MVDPLLFIFRYLVVMVPVVIVCVAMFWDRSKFAPVVRAGWPIALLLLAAFVGARLDADGTFTEAALAAYILDTAVIMALIGCVAVKIQARVYVYVMLMVAQVATFVMGAEDFVLYQFGPIMLGDVFWVVSIAGAAVVVPLLIASTKLVRPDILEFSEEDLWLRLNVAPSISVVAMLLYYLNIIVIQRMASPWVIIVFGALFAASLISNIVTTRIVGSALRSEKYSAELSEANDLLAMQKEQYRLITRNIEDARKARHDMRHQIGVIEGMLTDNTPDSLQQYFDEFKKQLPPEIEHRYCENYAVNTIIGEYARRAQTNGVDFDAVMQLSETSEGDGLTLAILVGNCLENAFEATEQMPEGERSVSIRSTEHGDMVNIVVKNSYNGHLEERGGKYLSHKRGYNEPGIGITSMQHIVAEHDGIMKIGSTENEFAVAMSLNVEHTKK